MKIQNSPKVGDFNRRVGGAKKPTNVAFSITRQTLEEERKCTAAIKLLLTEMVRQQLNCRGEGK